MPDVTLYTGSYPYKQWLSSEVTSHHDKIYARREEVQGEHKLNDYNKGRHKKRKVIKLRSQISELGSTKQQLISKIATERDHGNPQEGEMDCKQAPHLVGNLRRPTNESFGVHYCVG